MSETNYTIQLNNAVIKLPVKIFTKKYIPTPASHVHINYFALVNYTKLFTKHIRQRFVKIYAKLEKNNFWNLDQQDKSELTYFNKLFDLSNLHMYATDICELSAQQQEQIVHDNMQLCIDLKQEIDEYNILTELGVEQENFD